MLLFCFKILILLWLVCYTVHRAYHSQEVATIGVMVLDSVLSFSPADPTLVSCHVKMLEGALQTFVVYEEQILLQKYLEKVMALIIHGFIIIMFNNYVITIN